MRSTSNQGSNLNVDPLHRGVVDITGHPIMYAIQQAIRQNGHGVCKGRCVRITLG